MNLQRVRLGNYLRHVWGRAYTSWGSSAAGVHHRGGPARYRDNNLINHNVRYWNSNITIRIKITPPNDGTRVRNEF